jgi:hypothetical protein
METLAFLLLVTLQRNNTGVVSVAMELLDYGYLVTTKYYYVLYILTCNPSQNSPVTTPRLLLASATHGHHRVTVHHYA